MIDNVDTPGTLGGFAVNPDGIPISAAVRPSTTKPSRIGLDRTIDQFRDQFGNNAIVRIPLAAGQHSQENNFSEVRWCRAAIRRRRRPPPAAAATRVPAEPNLPVPIRCCCRKCRRSAADSPDSIGGSSKRIWATRGT